MGGGVLVLTKMQAILDEFIYIGDNSYSETTRLEAWRIIGEIVKVSPFFGLGPANYSYYTSLFPILGWYVQFNSHNNYVDIVAQTGIIGLLCFIWFIFEVMRFSWRVYKMVPKGGFLYAYVVGTFGGLTATFVAGMLGDWFLPYVYNATIRAMRTSIFPWLFLGGLVAVEQILKSDRVTR
jgi:O-antigen ligase